MNDDQTKPNKYQAAIISGLILVFIGMVILKKCHGFQPVDDVVYQWISSFVSDSTTSIMMRLTDVGSAWFIGSIVLALLVLNRNAKTGIKFRMIYTLLCAGLLNVVLKNLIQEPRPAILQLISESGYSFPSGHTMIAGAVYTAIIPIIEEKTMDKFIKRLLQSCCILVPVIVGISRIYLGVHWPSDVLDGWVLGLSIGLSSSLVYRNVQASIRAVRPYHEG